MNIEPRSPRETADVSKGDHSRKSFLINTLLIGGFLVMLYLVLTGIANAVAMAIPASWEARLDLGQGIYAMADEPIPDEVARIFTRLSEAADLPFAASLHVMEDDDINAFAFPGGHVVLTTGLLAAIESEEELAFVIAHELGHIDHRHLLRRFSRVLVFRLAIGLLFGGDPTLSATMGTLEELERLSFSRGQERDSDRYALALVDRVYGHVVDPTVFFDRLEDQDASLSLFSTHPLPPQRVKTLKRAILRENISVVVGTPLDPKP